MQVDGVRITAPFRMVGTKWRMSKRVVDVLNKFPNARRYVEPFGGAGTIFFHKTPHDDEIYNDLYGAHVNFFECLRDDDYRERLLFKLRLIPCCRQLFREAFQRLKKYRRINGVIDVDAAFDLFYTRRYSFHGCTHSFGGSFNERESYQNVLKTIEFYAERFKKVCIENRDFRDIFDIYDREDALFYCDPPYDAVSSHTSREYLSCWSEQDEQDLVDEVIRGNGSFVVSCYDNDNYRRLLDHGYERLDFEASCSCDLTPNKRVESIYWKRCSEDEKRRLF